MFKVKNNHKMFIYLDKITYLCTIILEQHDNAKSMTRLSLISPLLLLLLAMAGCNENEQHKTIGEKEHYFDEQLTSISTDGDSGCWIGSGTGDIWYVGEHIERSYNIGTDRIYKVAADRREPGPVKYWLGIRNSGLQRRIVTDGQPVTLDKYMIPAKGYSYSVYDILVTDNMVYAATSQGLYGLKRNSDTLTALYPGKDSETVRTGRPFMTHNICRYDSTCIVVASQYGMITIDPATNSTTIRHDGERIYNVSVSDNKIYALSDNKLYIDNPDGTTLEEVPLDFTAHVHHKVGKTHYFIEGGRVVLSENLHKFVSVTLRRKVPQYCGNVISTNGRKGFTLMLTDNALWRIPHHTGIFNVTGEILAACTDGQNMFYVNSANEVFRQAGNDSVATKIYDLPSGETVSKLMAGGGNLFYISNQRKLVCLDIQKTFIQNEIAATANVIYDAPTNITASYIKENKDGYMIYVGIHDELICIDDEGHTYTSRNMSGKYITAFCSSPNSNTVYASTLNHGVFYGNGENFEPLYTTVNTHFIRDIAVTSEHIPLTIILTNHHLILHDSQDTTVVKGHNKLLYVNDNLLYAMPEHGIQQYMISDGHATFIKEDFTDIRFNPEASFVLNGKVYLGSDIGVLQIDPYDENNTKWIIFNSDVPDIRMALIIGGFVLLLAMIAFVAYRRRKSTKLDMIHMQIDDLHKRLIGLKAVMGLENEDEKLDVENLMKELEQLQVDHKGISGQITEISEKIMHTNRNIGLKLSKHLNKQIEQISDTDAYEKSTLIEESRNAEASDNTVRILEQVAKNEKWLNLFDNESERLEEYRNNMAGTIIIEGLNDQMVDNLEYITENMRNKKLTELSEEMRQLDRQYRYLFSREAMYKIERYIKERREKIADKANTNEMAEALVAHIDKLIAEIGTKDRIEMLRELRITDYRIDQILICEEIAGKMQEYIRLREMAINDNEKRTEKKSSTDIEIEIADLTSFIPESIERLIARFYKDMVETDREIMNSVLKFPNLSAQSPKVLALLIADPKVKRTCLPGMLGMFGNMNPVISRLMNNRIKPGYKQLKAYAEKHPESMVCRILKLTEQ